MNAHTPVKVARKSELWDVALPDKLAAATNAFDFQKSSAGIAIRKLFPTFNPEGFRIDADSAIIERTHWKAPGTLFLTIPYKGEDGKPQNFNEALPMFVKFKVSDGSVEVADIEADLTSFDS